jgi:hypothetical protein
VALVVSQASQPNITSLGTLTGLYSTGNLTASFFVGGGNALSNIQGSSVSGPIPGGALVVTQGAQPNITSVGTLTGLYSTGNLTASFFVGGGNALSNINASNLAFGILSSARIYGNTLSNIQGSNISGNVAYANVALVVSQDAQPNITSVGTLTGLTISGDLTFQSQILYTDATLYMDGDGFHLNNGRSIYLNGGDDVVDQFGRINLYPDMFYPTSGIWAFGNFIYTRVIDGYGNVSVPQTGSLSVHTAPSPGFALTVADGAIIDNLTVTGSLIASGADLSSLNASNITTGILSSGRIYGNTLSNIDSSNITQPFANLVVSNTVTTTNISAAGFTSNSTNTVFNFSTLTVPFINATTMNVSGTSNLGAVVSSGQVVATGKSNVGVCAPIVYRQGGSATNWNSSGAFTSIYAITSGAVQMQFGANTMTATTQTITFPVGYTNSPMVFLSGVTAAANALYISTVSTTTAVVSGGSSGAIFYWQAIGI